jgi:glycosyltransferase involved in cell wall biosynthesis
MSTDATGPFLSLVVPVYDEEGNVGPLHGELTQVATALGKPYEIVFVNDGSRDGTLARLEALRAGDPHLRIVDLDGNFGEAAALSAGFAHARGEIVVTLDGDGQNDPAFIPEMLARLGPGVDVVSGRRHERQEAFWSRVLPSRIANGLIVLATGVPVHDCGCGLKAYRRRVVAGAQLPRGMNRFLPAILGVDPARVVEVWVTDRRRGSGRSHYGLSRTAVVLRDLLALPFLTRWAVGAPVRPAQVTLAVGLVAAIVSALGWPEAGARALLAALAVAGAVGWAIVYHLVRDARARAHGVFRVRTLA